MEFFERLKLIMKDRQKFSLEAQRIGEDLVMIIVPDKASGKAFNMTLPADDIKAGIDDEVFLSFREKANPEKATKQVSEVDIEPEDEEDEKPSKKDASKKSSAKPVGKKKAAPKKESKKKPAAKKPAKPAAKQKVIESSESKEKEILEEISENKPAIDEINTSVQEIETPEREISKENQFKQLMEDGRRNFNERKYSLSANLYQQAIDLFPEDAEAKRQLSNSQKWAKAHANLSK